MSAQQMLERMIRIYVAREGGPVDAQGVTIWRELRGWRVRMDEWNGEGPTLEDAVGAALFEAEKAVSSELMRLRERQVELEKVAS